MQQNKKIFLWNNKSNLIADEKGFRKETKNMYYKVKQVINQMTEISRSFETVSNVTNLETD